MSRTSPGPRGGFPQPASGPHHRLLNVATLLSVAAVALACVIAWVHFQIDQSGGSYTSFCNVNSAINCDLVLSSPFAKLLGIPIAWLAIPMYVALAVLYGIAARARASLARSALQLACAGTIAAAAFSAYMAGISLFVLQTLCLMCSGLYVLTGALLVIALVAPGRFAREQPGGSAPPLSAAGMAAVGAAAVLTVAGLAGATWPVSSGLPIGPNLALGELRRADPEFYDWYTKLPVISLPDNGGHTIGSAAAPVTIVEFSDFECGFCARNHVILNQLLARRPELVRIVYRHFPLDTACNDALETSVHTRACRAAEAAECAGRQNRFHEMADALFADQRRLFESNLFSLAEGLGLDLDEFRRCMNDHSTRADVMNDARAGARLDLHSTPTLFINGRMVTGTLPDLDRYEHAVLIESRLAAHPEEKVQS